MLVVVTLGGTTFALAQEATAPPADKPVQEERDEDDPAAQVPSSKYLEVAQDSLGVMRANLTKGLDELKDARDKKDAVQLTCVNEQVTAMKGILRVSEDAIVSLQEALASSDAERSRFEFRKIQVSKRKMDELLQAAVNCAGAEASESNTSVEMEIDPSLAEVDPYYGDPSFFFDPAEALVSGDVGQLGQDQDPGQVRPPPASTVL
jgi:hypothetical protein